LTRIGVTRCWGAVLPGECLPEGSPCAFSDQCCSDYCLPDPATLELTCRGSCAGLGQACTASADCCTSPVILKCQGCVCVVSDMPCVDIGGACTQSADCCVGGCLGGFCGFN
jgi:hypothetical protein